MKVISSDFACEGVQVTKHPKFGQKLIKKIILQTHFRWLACDSNWRRPKVKTQTSTLISLKHFHRRRRFHLTIKKKVSSCVVPHNESCWGNRRSSCVAPTVRIHVAPTFFQCRSVWQNFWLLCCGFGSVWSGSCDRQLAVYFSSLFNFSCIKL